MISAHGSSTFMVTNPLDTVLNKIKDNKEFLFTPTGSRYFGGTDSKSDYDFFTVESPGISRFCSKELGMCLASKISQGNRLTIGSSCCDYLDDPSVTCVFRTFGMRLSVPVDVQIIKTDWYEIKVKANNLIFENEYLRQSVRNSDKTAKRALWWGVMQTMAHNNPAIMRSYRGNYNMDDYDRAFGCGPDERSGLGIGLQ